MLGYMIVEYAVSEPNETDDVTKKLKEK